MQRLLAPRALRRLGAYTAHPAAVVDLIITTGLPAENWRTVASFLQGREPGIAATVHRAAHFGCWSRAEELATAFKTDCEVEAEQYQESVLDERSRKLHREAEQERERARIAEERYLSVRVYQLAISRATRQIQLWREERHRIQEEALHSLGPSYRDLILHHFRATQ